MGLDNFLNEDSVSFESRTEKFLGSSVIIMSLKPSSLIRGTLTTIAIKPDKLNNSYFFITFSSDCFQEKIDEGEAVRWLPLKKMGKRVLALTLHMREVELDRLLRSGSTIVLADQTKVSLGIPLVPQVS